MLKSYSAISIVMFILMISIAMDTVAKTLLFADFGSNRGTRAVALKWFAEELHKRSNGSLEIEFYWSRSLLSAGAALNGISDRAADMGSIIGYETPRQLRGYNIGDLPLNNSNIWVGMRAMYLLSTSHPVLRQEFEKTNLIYITNYSTGPVQLICTEEIKTLAGLRGIKLRGSGSYGKVFADLGAWVQRMSQPDIYQAMDSGLLECNQNYYYSMKAYKQYEIAKYVLELNWGQNLSFGIFMNKDAFAGLTATEKTIVSETGNDFIEYFAHLMLETNDKDKDLMLTGINGSSIKITTLKEGERQLLLATGKRYVEKWAAEALADGIDSRSILAAYQFYIDNLTRELDRKGYPWER